MTIIFIRERHTEEKTAVTELMWDNYRMVPEVARGKNGISPEPLLGEQPCQCHDFRLLASELWENKSL